MTDKQSPKFFILQHPPSRETYHDHLKNYLHFAYPTDTIIYTMDAVTIPSENVPVDLKSCEQILKRAKELKKAEPVVAYWCKLISSVSDPLLTNRLFLGRSESNEGPRTIR